MSSEECTKVQSIASDEEFSKITSSIPSSTLTLLYFHAPWAAPCTQMSTVLDALASTYPVSDPPKISFLSINAEELPEISEEHDVTAVPFIVLRRDGKTLDTISGSDATKLRAAVEKHAGAGDSSKSSQLPPEQKVTRPEQEPLHSALADAADPTKPKTDSAENTVKDLSSYAPDSDDHKTAPEYSSTKEPALSATTENDKSGEESLHERLTQDRKSVV